MSNMSGGATVHCAAYQMSDQMYCNKCKLVWDVNDPDPPRCGSAPNSTQLSMFEPYGESPVQTAKAVLSSSSLIATADALGYKLPPKTKQYLELLDKTYGPSKRG